MAKYGIPYMGGKDKIADDILSVLPMGKRFVDLFGGGFAMSHAALLSGKYEQVFYNELNPLLPKLIKDAIAGKYANERRWISREDFLRLKDTDGYVKYIWSFGNNGKDYLFGKDKEPIKKLGHEFVCFGKDIPGVPNIAETDMRVRRLYLQRFIKKNTGGKYELQELKQLQQLERLERLQQLERL
ncbi:DNA adenine methylase, partial [Candidatus Avelusimicrobium stercoris]|uniref:DNA adenine methylase n=1 Tax=Candidatus Avelusimicrobium stercoris TaxID=1947924 RepID=UPI003D0A5B9E